MRKWREPPGVGTWLRRSGVALACAICGALGGGSLVEAAAVSAHRPLALPSPAHLVANPLVPAGALCGALAALALVWMYRRAPATQAHGETEAGVHIHVPALAAPAQWIPFVTVTTAEQGAGTSSAAEASASHTRAARDARWSHRRARGVAARSVRARPHLYRGLPS